MRLRSSRLAPALALVFLFGWSAPVRAQTSPSPADAPAAQTAAAPAPETAATTAFDINGSASVGFRGTDVTGREEKYRELFNLQDGVRLVDFSLFGRAPQGSNRFADLFSVTASGLGDPFSAVQITARKTRLYDLRATWRRSQYFWDQATTGLPTGQNGLTTNHQWDTVRNFGSGTFLMHATNNLRVGFDLYRMNDAGMTVTTRSLDFFGAPGAWGSFARANPYLMNAPLTESVNRYSATIDYTRADWTFHYNGGYQTFDDNVTADAYASPERSINIDDPATANELLQHGAYQDFRRLTTPLSELSYDGKLTSSVDYRGGYMYYRYSGPAGLQADYNGSARSGSTFVPYTLSLDTRAQVREPTHVLEQGVTWKTSDRVNVLVDYRYARQTIDTTATFDSLFGSTASGGDTTEQWWENRNQLDADVEFMPSAQWLVRAGVRWLRNDVRVLEDGVVDPVRTSTITTVWPTLSASYKPSIRFSVRGDFDSINNDTSYTRITPHLDVGSRVLVRIKPTDQFSIEATLQARNRTLDATDYKDRVRSTGFVGTYTLSDAFAVFGGYSYDRLVSTGTSTFLRGPAPLDVVIDDRAENNVWQGGVSLKVRGGLGLDVAGNYVKTNGQGVITGELPRYGEVTFPYLSGALYYDVRKVGRVSIDLQHMSYTEAIITANNFRARVIMIRFTREF
jgi:hypothetical protein